MQCSGLQSPFCLFFWECSSLSRNRNKSNQCWRATKKQDIIFAVTWFRENHKLRLDLDGVWMSATDKGTLRRMKVAWKQLCHQKSQMLLLDPSSSTIRRSKKQNRTFSDRWKSIVIFLSQTRKTFLAQLLITFFTHHLPWKLIGNSPCFRSRESSK